jgi:hypothetical protein
MLPDNPHAVHGTLLGMTSHRTLAEPLPEIRTIAQPGGFYRVYLTALTLRFGFQNMDVSVIGRLKGEDCLQDHVLAHEHHHVDISRETLTEFAPKM